MTSNSTAKLFLSVTYVAATETILAGPVRHSGHTQIVFEDGDPLTPLVETEVNGPPLLIFGDWVFEPFGQAHGSTSNYISDDDQVEDPTRYGIVEIDLAEGQTAEDVWTVLESVRAALVAAAPNIDYAVEQNSNSYIRTMLYSVGIELGDYLPQATPIDVVRFPGENTNVLFGATIGGQSNVAISLDLSGPNKGSSGHDVIRTGIGNDTIDGGAGDDTLTGGAGDDIFIKRPGESDDTITDFEQGADDDSGDKIDVSAYDLTFDEIVFEVEANGLRVRLESDSILLQGVGLSTLNEVDFLGLLAGNVAPTAVPIDAGSVLETSAVVTIDLLVDARATDSDGGTLSVENLSVTDQSGAEVAFGLVGSNVSIDPAQFAADLATGETATLTLTYDISDGQGGTTPNNGQLVIDGQDGPFVWYLDDDGDGFGQDDPATNQTTYSAPADTVGVAGDNDDADATVFPGAPEINDGKDNDQDGETDEDNANPVADAESFELLEDATLTVAASILLDGDTDADGDTLELVNVFAPVNGVVSLDDKGDADPGNDDVIFIPTAGYDGPASFDYTVSDGFGGEDSVTVTLTIRNREDGTEDDDLLTGTTGPDRIQGFAGNDTIDGGAGDDTLTGGAGDDALSGEGGSDHIADGDGADLISGGANDDVIKLIGTTFHSAKYAAFNASSADQAGTGERINLAGKVKIEAVIDGGTDANTVQLSEQGDAFFLHDAFSAFHHSIDLSIDSLGQTGTARLLNIQIIEGLGGDDIIDLTSPDYSLAGHQIRIDGGADNDVVWGSDADETILGGAGNDILFGGIGTDVLIGGIGEDIFQFTRTSSGTSVLDFDPTAGDRLQFFSREGTVFDPQLLELTEMGVRVGYDALGVRGALEIDLARSSQEFSWSLNQISTAVDFL